jgi:hypothetical protein
VDRAKEDGPDAFTDFLKSDELSSEQMGDEDLFQLPADGGILTHTPNLKVFRIGDRLGMLGERPVGGLVDGGRRVLAERFVRSLVVVDVAEVIEPALLGA